MDDFTFNLTSEKVLELATSYVQKYADYIENLPFDLQRLVTRMREIDCTCRELMTEIENLYGNFINEKDINIARRATGNLVKMQCLLGRCQELGDEKIHIVQQITESIETKKRTVENSSIRFKEGYRPDYKNEFNGKREQNKLDCPKSSKRSRRSRHNCIDKHEKMEKSSPLTSIDDGIYFDYTSNTTGNHLPNENLKSNPVLDGGGNSSTSTSRLSESVSKLKDDHPPSRKSEKSEKKEASPASSASPGSAVSNSLTSQKNISKPNNTKVSLPTTKATITPTNINGANNRLSSKGKKKKKKVYKPVEKTPTRSPSPTDYPIDPDEPTYCLCEQVSFGQMIGCDNKKCPIEWFHFSCVGLSHKPKGKWYCPDCTRDMKDRRKEGKKEHR